MKYIMESRVESTTVYFKKYSRYGIPLHYGYTLLQLRGLEISRQILLLS